MSTSQLYLFTQPTTLGKNLIKIQVAILKSRTVPDLPTLERVYKNVTITVTSGDITKLEVDAIVNAANSRLIMGGGVAGAILRAGGREIQEEANKKAPVPVGKAVATTAGKLKAKYVIHAPTMERPAMPTSKQNVRLATRGALECARKLGVSIIAFPGMGTGVGGLNVEEAVNVMVDEVKKHIESGTPLKNIMLVGFTADLTRAFERALQKSLP
jgi:O-acetyl-ADP-ribose deacetylase (regulator of RNase III)